MTTTVGIDLAVQINDTAACTIDWSTRTAEIESRDTDVVELLCDAAAGSWVGIDVPLGWPTRFASAVGQYMAGQKWSGSDRDFHADTYPGLRLRVTDLWLEEEMRDQRIHPISVSADKLGAPAMRAAWLMTRAGLHDADRADTQDHGVLEVYPKAAMARWGILPATSYKKSGQEAKDSRLWIVEAILEETGVRLEHAGKSPTDHEVDALVAALVARAATLGHVVTCQQAQQAWEQQTGGPELDFARAPREGWIHIPCRCGLSVLETDAECDRNGR